jgi:acetyltransferase-like isoleucine patch superfamily enzyme
MSEYSHRFVRVDKAAHVHEALNANPIELIRFFKVAMTTAKYRYLVHCIGKGTVVGVGTEIINAVNVHIGEHCLLQDHIYMRAGNQGLITLGDRVAINSFAKLFGHGGIEIGEDTQIGPGSLITTTDHNVNGSLESRFKKVCIGKRVWIGANVTILPGVSIGDFSVIGAGTVVTKDIPSKCVAVGVPARVIKEGVIPGLGD